VKREEEEEESESEARQAGVLPSAVVNSLLWLNPDSEEQSEQGWLINGLGLGLGFGNPITSTFHPPISPNCLPQSIKGIAARRAVGLAADRWPPCLALPGPEQAWTGLN
jgi:hypothetical protein